MILHKVNLIPKSQEKMLGYDMKIKNIPNAPSIGTLGEALSSAILGILR